MMPLCRTCKRPTDQRFGLTYACSIDHAIDFTAAQKAKREAAAEKRIKSANRLRKAQLKTLSQLTKEAQIAFNSYIRERDRELPCICCGQWGPDEAWKPGGQWDAGHFFSRGAHPELRFVEDNCHKQLKSCNAGSGKYARKNKTVTDEYAERLLIKIGPDRMAWLQGPHEPKKYTREQLIEIKQHYTKRRHELEKDRL